MPTASLHKLAADLSCPPSAQLRRAGYKTRSWSWSWSFSRSRTSTAPFYRTPPLIGCLDTATAHDIDLGVQLPAFDVLFVLNIARRQREVR